MLVSVSLFRFFYILLYFYFFVVYEMGGTYSDFTGKDAHARKRDLDLVADIDGAVGREDLDALDGSLYPFVVFWEIGELLMVHG